MNRYRDLLIVLVLPMVLCAQPAYNEQPLTTSGGDAVSMDREWAFVGDVANNKVHAYKLDYATFQWVAQNFPTAPKQGRFGASVAVHGDKVVVGAPDVETWRMEANTITIPNTYPNPNFTTITLQRTYEEPPLIFALASNDGSDPAAVKIKNRTNNSFEIVHAEPMNEDGPHAAMNISYFAIERGNHVLSDGTHIYAGEIQSKKQRRSSAAGDEIGWETITYPSAFGAQPMVLAEIQTMENEVNAVPSQPSEPWLSAAVRNVGVSSFELTMDRSEVLTATQVDKNETIAFLVMDVRRGAFTDTSSNPITFESIYSEDIITGWGTCKTTAFTQLFVASPLVVATKNTLDGGDGGWLRRCSLSSSNIGLTVDEDRYQDTERNHTNERAGILAFSEAFVATFKQGEAYLYQFSTALNDWELKETIEPTIYSDDMKFGTSVALQDDGTRTHVAVGAPNASTPNAATGRAFTYSYNGTALTPVNSFYGNINYSRAFGTSIDMKGNYLIVGAPDEESTALNDFVGAAYTFKYDGTSWIGYPSTGSERIKKNTANEKFGSHVAIDHNGSISLMASNITTTSSYIYKAGSSWSQSYTKAFQDGGGVDTDEDIHLIAQRASRLSFFSRSDGDASEPRPLNISRGATGQAYTSVSLYKEQVLVNDPANTQAIAIDVPCGIKPTKLIANEWAIVSVPCGNNIASISQIFGDDMDAVNGGSAVYGDNGNWVMYENGVNYTGKASDAIEMQDSNEMHLGQGYWIISDKDVTLKADATAITTRTALDFSDPSTNRPAEVAGYYLYDLPAISGKLKIIVGNPFPRTVHWKDVMEQDDTLNSRVEIGTGGNPIMNTTGYVYDTTQSGQPYRAITSAGTPGISDVVKPYQGVWVKKEVGIANAKLCFPFEK